ncbi:proteasome accessory factor PafA2 family protein [Mycobacterium kansasii]|uniref:proteasome accessory factor PafA2 family protein n=1 Tax=Mycobacterium kansasii TaxID=1768 RepID=UPI0004B90FF6|nr:proteasome accessory factor PafA2 family protein [Mycobacterium kansasii]
MPLPRYSARQTHPLGLRGGIAAAGRPGFDLSRSAGPPPVVDADEVGRANMILTNGARLYVDHAHPEYSAPECTDPLDAVIWDKAG